MSAPPLPEPCTPEPPEALHGVPAGAPRLLVFDSSTELLALAVNGPGGSFSLTVTGGAAASATLLPQALRLLQRAGLTLRDLQAVGFGSGPGAFTGLRTACAVAQGLGLGLGVPLLPVDSLLVVAEDARLQWALRGPATGALEVAVLMDARMQEVYGGRYRWHSAAPSAGPPRELPVDEARQQPPDAWHSMPPGHWQTLQSPQLYKLPDLLHAWSALPQTLLAGSALSVFADQLAPLAAAHRVPVERNRAAALLHLALRAWAAGQAVDAAQALPLYVRDKVAQTTQERDRARDTAAAERVGPATAGNPGSP